MIIKYVNACRFFLMHELYFSLYINIQYPAARLHNITKST